MRLDSYKKAGDVNRYKRELAKAAGATEEGRTILDKHKAEDILADKTATIAQRIMATEFLQDNRKPFSEAQLTDIERSIREELSTVGDNEGKAKWNDELRDRKIIYDAEKKAMDSAGKAEAKPEVIEFGEDTITPPKEGETKSTMRMEVDGELLDTPIDI